MNEDQLTQNQLWDPTRARKLTHCTFFIKNSDLSILWESRYEYHTVGGIKIHRLLKKDGKTCIQSRKTSPYGYRIDQQTLENIVDDPQCPKKLQAACLRALLTMRT